MIKPVLGSSYRQYILSFVAAVLSLVADAGGQLCAGHCAERELALGMLLAVQIAAGVLAFVVMIVLSRHPLVVEVKRQFCLTKK